MSKRNYKITLKESFTLSMHFSFGLLKGANLFLCLFLHQKPTKNSGIWMFSVKLSDMYTFVVHKYLLYSRLGKPFYKENIWSKSGYFRFFYNSILFRLLCKTDLRGLIHEANNLCSLVSKLSRCKAGATQLLRSVNICHLHFEFSTPE